MKTKSTYPLAQLQELTVQKLVFRQVLDYGRYTIRIDPDAGRGWFKSEILSGQTTGTLHFDGKQVVSTSEELPPQVESALHRAGYLTDLLCAAGF